MNKNSPDPNVIHPIAGYDKEIYVKPTITNPNIIVGDFTYIADSEGFRDIVLLDEDYSMDLSQNTTLKSLDINRELLEHQEKMIQTTRMPTLAAFGQISYIGQERVDISGLMGGGAAAGRAAAVANQSKFW